MTNTTASVHVKYMSKTTVFLRSDTAATIFFRCLFSATMQEQLLFKSGVYFVGKPAAIVRLLFEGGDYSTGATI